ncbi:MAG: glycoside hydrolase family 36 N-terminal domain-containing protein, partial [Silvibacterium sp.]
MSRFGFIFVLAAIPICAVAQQPGVSSPFHYDEKTRVFRIETAESTYAFGVNGHGELQSIYWGGRLLESDPLLAAHSDVGLIPFETEVGITAQEFGGWGGGMYVEPALKITFPDGNRDLVLHYVSYAITPSALTVLLKDISRDVFVTLRYTVDPETGIIGRSAVIRNKTSSPFMIEQAAAGSFNLPVGNHYELNYLTGRWASEFHLQQREIKPGKIV